MFPVRGDVRLVDGNETLVFTGSQKAISWLNKIFASLHESSLPTRLQKYSRRSSSAPCGTLESGSREFTAEHPADTQPTKVLRRPVSREKSPRHSPRAGVKKARTWGSPPPSPSIRDHPTSLSRQKKSFLRGKRPATSSPRDSTISSRAKSCEQVIKPQSSGTLSPTSPQKGKLPPSLNKSAPPLSAAALNATNGMDPSPTTPERFSITPRRVRSRERHYRAAVSNSQESPSSVRARDNLSKVLPSGRRRPPVSSTDDGDESQTQFRNERPITERMKTLSTAPFTPLARMTISSTNRRRPPVGSAALIRRFRPPPKLTSIPELLMQRPGTPIRPASPKPMEHYRPWENTKSPTDSTGSLELESSPERSNVTSPITPRETPTRTATAAVFTPPRPKSSPPKSPRAAAAARPMTPIASDFLRNTPGTTPGRDEESWRRLLSTPNKTFFKNPLYSKALERKQSTALRSLAHPTEMITESTLKQFSSATRKFISRALTRISKVDNHLTTVICQ